MLSVESFWCDLSKITLPYKQTDIHYLLAYSGGLDSHVLLHLLVQLKKLKHINDFSVVHVNHQLHADSSQWAEHCVQQCRQYKVDCNIIKVTVNKNSGVGLEAAARQARYAAFESLVTDKTLLLTAQHADDQIETFLLQSLRGSGVKGLAAMPAIKSFTQGYLCRPLLSSTQQEIADYALKNNLKWIDDPSNKNTKFDRNYLRHEVIPALKKRWPAIHKTFLRVTQYQAENKKLVEELAQIDLLQLQKYEKEINNNQLSISGLQTLSLHRKKNVLRYWLHNKNNLSMPDSTHLMRILNEVLTAAEDAEPCVSWSDAIVRRYNNYLYADSLITKEDFIETINWKSNEVFNVNSKQLVTEELLGQGLSAKKLQSQNVTIRFRQGGEVCRPLGRGEHQHKLKKLFQEWQVPPWQRNTIPLLYVDDVLAQVVGYCLCEPFAAMPDELGYCIQWNKL